MSIKDIFVPKPMSTIRNDVPSRFSSAKIMNDLYDLNSDEKYTLLSNIPDYGLNRSKDEIFEKIISAFQKGDQVILENEIYYGEFLFRDYILLTELFTDIQKWDVCFCESLFNGEINRFEIQVANKTRNEYYHLSTKDLQYKHKLKFLAKDLELVKIHKAFESLGGSHEITSRFVDLVQRAGWENGVKIIKALLNVISKLQNNEIIGQDKLWTQMLDRIQSDDYDIIYKFSPGDQGYHLIVRHLFVEDTTSVRVFQGDNEVWDEEIFEW